MFILCKQRENIQDAKTNGGGAKNVISEATPEKKEGKEKSESNKSEKKSEKKVEKPTSDIKMNEEGIEVLPKLNPDYRNMTLKMIADGLKFDYKNNPSELSKISPYANKIAVDIERSSIRVIIYFTISSP